MPSGGSWRFMAGTTASVSVAPQNRVRTLVGHASSVRGIPHLLESQMSWMSLDLEPQVESWERLFGGVRQHRGLRLELGADLLLDPSLLTDAPRAHPLPCDQAARHREDQYRGEEQPQEAARGLVQHDRHRACGLHERSGRRHLLLDPSVTPG